MGRPSLDWQADAACAGIPEFTQLELVEQLAACNDCPVVSECLDYACEIHTLTALNGRIGVGAVYGGRTPTQVTREIRYRTGLMPTGDARLHEFDEAV